MNKSPEITRSALVTGGSANDVAPIAALLLNLKTTQRWIDRVIVFHDGISAKDRDLMQKIMPVDFIKYRFPGDERNFNEIIRYTYHGMVFCKYECFKLLEKYDHVVWSDYDVVFLDDISELVFGGETGFQILMYRETDEVSKLKNQFRRTSVAEMAGKYDLERRSVATGLFVLSKKLPDPGSWYRRCIGATEEFGKHLALPDQAILDIVMQEKKFEPEEIPWIYAAHPVHDEALIKAAKILHAYAQPKFWSGLHNDIWEKNYHEWLAMCGSPWRYTWRDKWRAKCRTAAFLWHRLRERLKNAGK